ncbi:TRAP transporter TatT component family protein [Verrucomicrobia bacterium]|nr:TRAP transporter TatT component family protein [Verrucomicrobiota bacterium]
MRDLKQFVIILGTVLITMLFSGCSPTRMAVNMVGDALASGGDTWSSDDDPLLIKDALPFSLKLTESLLAKSPEHDGLLFTAASGFTQYAYAFVQMDAERLEDSDFEKALEMKERAKKLFIRARGYGLQALAARHEGFIEEFRIDPDVTIKRTNKEDVRMLYWTAVAWAASIAVDKTDMDAIGDLPFVSILIDRALELDPDWSSGTLQSFMVTYAMTRQDLAMPPEEAARAYYARALELTGGRDVGVHVALAESVSVANQDRKEFETLLNKALEVDVDERKEWRLFNIIMQQRAEWLLSRTDELFF